MEPSGDTNNDLMKQILHCQNSILQLDPPERNRSKVLHYLRKLSKLSVQLQELEATGIGKTINSLRKVRGSIGDEATLLVTKWKSIVKKQLLEEERVPEIHQNSNSPSYSSGVIEKYGNGRCSNHEKNSGKKIEKKVHMITIKKRNTSESKKEHFRDEKNLDFGMVEDIAHYPHDIQILSSLNMEEKKEDSVKMNSENSEVMNSKKGKHYDKKRKKSDEKRHQRSSKHKSKDGERHHRHKSSSTGDNSCEKHRNEKLKSVKRKHDSSKEIKSQPETAGSSDIKLDPGDDFGAALLGIEYSTVSPPKKKFTKSESYSCSPSPAGSCRDPSDFEPLPDDIGLETLPSTENVITSNLYSPAHSTSSSSKHDVKTEEDMLNLMITTKNHRTKVYSGTKGYTFIKFPTLFELCVRILQDNFDALEFTGGVPYDVLKPVLEKVSAQQLYTFENYNPYLIGDTEELWEYHAEKQFKKSQRLKDESWRDFYLRCVEEREEKFKNLTVNISQSIANSAPVRKTKLTSFDSMKLPRNVVRIQAKNALKMSPKKTDIPPTASQSIKERLCKEALSVDAIQIPSKISNSFKRRRAPLMEKALKCMKGMKR